MVHQYNELSSNCYNLCYDAITLSLKLFLCSDQEDRQWSIREFREGRKDVLVATDVASKGLDFPNIQHVINYDMPTDIENYGKYA